MIPLKKQKYFFKKNDKSFKKEKNFIKEKAKPASGYCNNDYSVGILILEYIVFSFNHLF